jgi:hypothetical protein
VGVRSGEDREELRPRDAHSRSSFKFCHLGLTPPLTPPRQGEGNRASRTVGAILTLSAAILLGPEVLACTVPEGFARLATPEAEIAYRWEPSVLKVGQFFAAEVIACRAPGAGAVREIVLDAQMPAHGHGMNYQPTTTSTGPGRFRVTGLMLHMAGTWRLTFDLVHGETRTRLTQEVTLEP